jgi:hypothetical protein
MKKLSFLFGRWPGEARVLRGSGEPLELAQTEEAQYKLGGLILMIEGIGRSKSDGEVALQMRAYNDGRYLQTELKLAEDGRGIVWGFALGEIKTNSVLRISEKGEWTELTEITVGAQPPQKLTERVVKPISGQAEAPG